MSHTFIAESSPLSYVIEVPIVIAVAVKLPDTQRSVGVTKSVVTAFSYSNSIMVINFQVEGASTWPHGL